MELNLADVLEGIAFAAPEREALVVGDRRFTWGELWSRTARFGEWLTSLDLGLRSDPATTIGWPAPCSSGSAMRYCTESAGTPSADRRH